MKKLIATLSMGVLYLLLSHTVTAQQAALQIIHNSPDPDAAVVDIYVNGNLYKDDVAFRAATAFDSVPSNTNLNVGIAPATSNTTGNGAADIIDTFGPYSLAPATNYVIIAQGVLTPNNFQTNVNGVTNITFGLEVIANANSSSSTNNTVDVAVSHGSPDAPDVDIFINGSDAALAPLNDVPYDANTGAYLSVPAQRYLFDVAASADSTNPVATFYLDASTLGGGAGVIFASGFLTTNDEPAGALPFGLFAALANGTVAELTAVSGTADIQVFHNSPDPAAALVDIYINTIKDTIKLDDVAFREGTSGFVSLPAGYPVTVAVAGSNSASISDAIPASLSDFELVSGEDYFVAAQGVLDPSQFTTTNANIGFGLVPLTPAVRSDPNMNNVSVAVWHGAPDAPDVDIFINGAEDALPALNNVPYGANTGAYLSIPASEYVFTIAASADSTNPVASFYLDASGLGGGAGVVFASGFLAPANQPTGAEAFTLLAVLADGTVEELKTTGTANAQIIHNAADPGVAVVDIYLDIITDTIKIEDVAFRKATMFTEVPSEYPIKVTFAGENSTDISQGLVTIATPELAAGENYHVIANGVTDAMSTDWTMNPDMRSIGFELFYQTGARTTGSSTADVDLSVLHGSTDAPTVDILVNAGTPPFVDNAAYGDIAGYQTVAPGDYDLNITLDNDNANILYTFGADVSTLAGRAGIVLASGFLTNVTDATANRNGEAFGLLLILDDGTDILLPLKPVNTNINGDFTFSAGLESIAPNPATNQVNVEFSVKNTIAISVQITDARGREVKTDRLGTFAAGTYTETIMLDNLKAGSYTLTIAGRGFRASRKLVIIE